MCFTRRPGVWRVLSKISHETSETSQTENWHVVTPLVSEFWCAVSALVIVAVGVHHASPAVITAGVLSFASHSVPYRVVHNLDYVGIAVVSARVIQRWSVWSDHSVWISGLIAVYVGLVDSLRYRPLGHAIGTRSHVLWHLLAALFLDRLERSS